MGRKKIEIDWDKVDAMLKAQCSGTAVCSALGLKPQTLYTACKRDKKKNFSDYATEKKAQGMENIRVKQYELALMGDKTMLVWLGKQYLGQSEQSNNNVNHSITDNRLPTINIDWSEPEPEGNIDQAPTADNQVEAQKD